MFRKHPILSGGLIGGMIWLAVAALLNFQGASETTLYRVFTFLNWIPSRATDPNSIPYNT